MTINKTSNRDCAVYVDRREPFKAHNLFGEWDHDKDVFDTMMDCPYVVYSYGRHFPIYAWLDGKWYENTDKYSVSTSKHQTQARPNANTIKVNTRGIVSMLLDTVESRCKNLYELIYCNLCGEGHKPADVGQVYGQLTCVRCAKGMGESLQLRGFHQ